MKREHESLGSQRFWIRVDFLKRSKFYSNEQLIKYQNKCLRRLITLAYNKSIYYRNLMDKEGIKPNDINDINDLRKFPISTKDDLKKAGNNILTSLNTKQITSRYTGGSSGNPLCVQANNSFYSKDKANTFYYVNLFGHDIFNSKSARIYGESIKDNLGKDILFAKGNMNKRLELNVYLINPNNIEEIIEQLLIHKPRYIHGRMSAITHLSKLISNTKKDLNIDSLENIFVDGETVLPIDRQIIEKTFKVKLINIYGHTEGSLFAIQNYKNTNLDVQGITGIVELVNKKNCNITSSDIKGELVVTGLNNFLMPFIRYQTGDEVTLINQIEDRKHNYLSFRSLVGRKIDYLYTKTKDPIPLSSLFYNYDDVNWENVKYWEAYQPKLGEVSVTLELFSNFNSNQKLIILNRIERELNLLSGKSLVIKVKEGSIKPNKRGKVRNFKPYNLNKC